MLFFVVIYAPGAAADSGHLGCIFGWRLMMGVVSFPGKNAGVCGGGALVVDPRTTPDGTTRSWFGFAKTD
eukprot:6488855-Amphidinium_carterae.1